MPTYYIQTYGCQMNKSDSERIVSVLENSGWTACSKEEDADLIIVVACSVRQTAIDRVYGCVLKYDKLKKKNLNLKTILTGCVLDFDKKKLSEKFNMVCDIREIAQISNFQFLISNFPQNTNNYKEENYDYLSIKPKYQSSFQAYVPIMTGCNNFCSYCVVPYTRGREYSRPAEEILYEVKALLKKGYKEITLIGQNVNSYKGVIIIGQNVNSYQGEWRLHCLQSEERGLKLWSRDANLQIVSTALPCVPQGKDYGVAEIPPLIPPYEGGNLKTPLLHKEGLGVVSNFPALLRLINSIPGDFWIRFATSHPKDMSDELINAIAECEKITPYVHLPIQAGSDKILKAMNRKYTKQNYLDLIKKIKKKIPDAMLSTDIIVGFPGETEKDFEETADVFKKVKFSMAYIARYSPRIGVASYSFSDNVSHEEKAHREHALTDILKKTALRNNKKFIGKTVRVLIERQGEDIYFGKTAQFVNVKINQFTPFIKEGTAIGQFVNVKITNATSFGMEGAIKYYDVLKAWQYLYFGVIFGFLFNFLVEFI